MTIKEKHKLIKDNIKWSIVSPGNRGGQQVGIPVSIVTLISEDLDLEITFSHYRSQLKNKEMCLILFELALMEIVK